MHLRVSQSLCAHLPVNAGRFSVKVGQLPEEDVTTRETVHSKRFFLFCRVLASRMSGKEPGSPIEFFQSAANVSVLGSWKCTQDCCQLFHWLFIEEDGETFLNKTMPFCIHSSRRLTKTKKMAKTSRHEDCRFVNSFDTVNLYGHFCWPLPNQLALRKVKSMRVLQGTLCQVHLVSKSLLFSYSTSPEVTGIGFHQLSKSRNSWFVLVLLVLARVLLGLRSCTSSLVLGRAE